MFKCKVVVVKVLTERCRCLRVLVHLYIHRACDVFLLLLLSVAHCVLSSCGVFISSDISYQSCAVILGFLLHVRGLKLQGPDIWLLTTHTLSCQDLYLLRLTFLRMCVFQPIWIKSEKSGWCFSQPAFTLENHLLPSSVRVRPCLVSTHTYTARWCPEIL